MDNSIGLVAVILSLGFPLGAMYTYYCVRKLRSPERRWVILLVSGALGYMAATGIIAYFSERDAWTASALGIIPFALGPRFFR